MSEDSMLKCLIAFILGFLISRMMQGNGFNVGADTGRQYPRPPPNLGCDKWCGMLMTSAKLSSRSTNGREMWDACHTECGGPLA